MDNILAAITEATNKIKEAEEVHRNLVKNSLNGVLTGIAKTGLVGHIYVYGYTPGFNDGEPCTHGAYGHVNLANIVAEEIGNSFVSEYIEDKDGESVNLNDISFPYLSYRASPKQVSEYEEALKSVQAMFDFPIKIDKETQNVVNRVIKQVLIPALDDEFGTDYQILYVFNKDGTYERHYQEYDCGY